MAEPHNHRHSSKSATWQTPPWIAAASRVALNGIDLDPASCARANHVIQAECYFTPRENGLSKSVGWRGLRRPSSIFLNPPGGWHKGNWGDSEIRRWWAKTITERKEKYFGHMLWLSFSIDTLQVSQVKFEYSLLDFPTCFFKKRISFIDAKTGKTVPGNTHASSMTYIPGRVNNFALFAETFEPFGKIVVPK